MTKRCINCFHEKPTSQFYRKLDKFQSWCKACNAEVKRAWSTQHKARKIAERWREVDQRRKVLIIV